MNTKIISSIVLGNVLLAMQAPAVAVGQCMHVGVDTPNSGTCLVIPARFEYTGTEGFRDAVSAAVGAATAQQDQCPGAHVFVRQLSCFYNYDPCAEDRPAPPVGLCN